MSGNLIAIGIGLCFVGFVLLRIMSAVRSAAKADRLAEEAEAREIADRIDDDIGALPPDAAREELRRWSADK